MQIFHSYIFKSAGPGISFNVPAPKSSFQRGRNRSIYFHSIVLGACNNAIPNNIPASRVPDQPPISSPTSHVFHPQLLGPRLSTGPSHDDCITRAQLSRIFDSKALRPDGNVVILDGPQFAKVICSIILSNNPNQRPAIQPSGDNHRSILAHSLSSQNNTGRQ